MNLYNDTTYERMYDLALRETSFAISHAIFNFNKKIYFATI